MAQLRRAVQIDKPTPRSFPVNFFLTASAFSNMMRFGNDCFWSAATVLPHFLFAV